MLAAVTLIRLILRPQCSSPHAQVSLWSWRRSSNGRKVQSYGNQTAVELQSNGSRIEVES